MDRLIGLVLMRWRVELRGLTWARERALALLLVVPGVLIFAAMASLLAFFGVRALARGSPEAVLPVLSLAATGVGVIWAFSPVLAGVAFSETHDLSRLLHFPIPLSTLVGSSLVANLLQPMVLAEVPVVLALSLALSGSPATFLLALAGAVSALAFMLAAAQVAGLALHALSRNRRLQDLALFASLGFGFLLSLLPLMLIYGARWPVRGLLRAVLQTDVFAFSPFAWGVRAAVHGGAGELAPFLFWGTAQLLALAGAVGLAAALVQRIYRGELALGPSARAATARARMRLGGAVGALLEKDLRSAWRDPAIKATLLMGLVGPLLFLVFVVQAGSYSHPGSGLLWLASFVGVSAFGSNAFGLERRGVALLMGFPVARWRLLVAKNLAALSLRLPGVLVVLIAGLFVAPLYLPAALTIALCAMLVSAGADNFVSILFPVAAPEPGKNPYGGGAAGGRGLGAAMLGAALFVATLMLAAPFVLLCWLPPLFGRLALWLVTLPLALAGSAAAYAMLVAFAEKLLVGREPELLERILSEA